MKGFEIGAVDYVGKPFNAHELLARVNTHLTVDQLRRSLAEAGDHRPRISRNGRSLALPWHCGRRFHAQRLVEFE